MALRFMESFEHGSSTDYLFKWSGATTVNAFLSSANGRFGTGLRSGAAWKHTLDAQATWILGCAFRSNVGLPTAGGHVGILGLWDGSTEQVDVRMTSDGKLRVTRNGTQLGSDGATFIDQFVWHYIELKATIHNTTGSIEVRLNGATEITLTNQDTQATANATADAFAIRSTHVGSYNEYDWDDLYVCDGTGSAPTNNFLGDVRVEARFPNGNGNSSVFVGSDGNSTDNYLLVDETDADDDTTYVQGSSVGDKDTYAYQDLTPTTGTVYGVQIVPYARKTDAGSRSICTVARLSGTEVDGPNRVLSTTYQYFPDIRETKPGGGAWSITDVNNAEFGVKVTV